MNVFSAFDGMSCGMLALERAGINVNNYFSSEIDKWANKVSQANYPDIIRLGDIQSINYQMLPRIDLLIGGSPCQGFSMAGKGLNFKDPRSALFFEFVHALKTLKPKYFMLENVKMKKQFQDEISKLLGCQPILINSALVSSQNRQRLYWTNIPNVKQPEDFGVVWGDVREKGIEWGPMHYSDKAMEWIGRHGSKNGKKLKIHNDNEKMQMIEASHFKKHSSQRFFGVIDTPASIVGRRINTETGKRDDYNKNVPVTQCLQVKHDNSKMGCLTTVLKDTVVSTLPPGRYPDVYAQLEEGKHYRYVTPIECERLQTVPDNYTNCVSNSQRYKILGNGWTIEAVAHIFRGLKNA